jgi:hypothetical protein
MDNGQGQDVVAQILQMIGQLDPEQMQALLGQLEGGAQPQEQVPVGGTISPDAGPNGVPVK